MTASAGETVLIPSSRFIPCPLQIQQEDGFAYRWKPMAHQRTEFLRSRDKPYHAFFMEPRTGKTKVVLDTAAYLFLKGKIKQLIVVAPNGMHREWVTEALLHFPMGFPWVGAFYQASPTKSQRESMSKAVVGTKGLRLIAINIDAMSHDRGASFIEELLAEEPDSMLVVDEVHQMRTPGAKRTRTLYRLSKLARFRRILSGTPLNKGFENLFAPIRFLSPSILGHTTYLGFKMQYCVLQQFAGATFTTIIGYQNLDHLFRLLEPHVSVAKAADCLDLPGRQIVRKPVPLGAEQQKIYNQLRKELLAELEGGWAVAAALAITRLLRLQQILSGFLPVKALHRPGEEDDTSGQDENGEWLDATQTVYRFPNPRATVALELIRAAPGKVLVWSRFKEDVLQLSTLLTQARIGFVTYTGSTGGNARAKALKQFREDPACLVFLSSHKVGGPGLTLNEADTSIFYSHLWGWDDWKQPLERNYGGGQEKPVMVYVLEAPGTIEQRILRVVDQRKNMASIVTEASAYGASAELLRLLLTGDPARSDGIEAPETDAQFDQWLRVKSMSYKEIPSWALPAGARGETGP